MSPFWTHAISTELNCHKEQITDNFIFLFSYCASPSTRYPYPISQALTLLKYFSPSRVIPSYWNSEKWFILGEETKRLSSFNSGKNSKTFQGTDSSRTTRPLLLRGNGAYQYKANLIFKKIMDRPTDWRKQKLMCGWPFLTFPCPQQNVSLKFSPISTNN